MGVSRRAGRRGLALGSLPLERARRRPLGGTPFCAASGSDGCAALWDAPFALAAHRLTGVPIAGWGVVWGLTALGLPLVALCACRRRKAASGPGLGHPLRRGGRGDRRPRHGHRQRLGEELLHRLLRLLRHRGGLRRDRAFWLAEAGLPEPRGAALALGASVLACASARPRPTTPQNARKRGERRCRRPGSARRNRAMPNGTRPSRSSWHPWTRLKQTLSDSLDVYRRAPAKPTLPPRYLLGPAKRPCASPSSPTSFAPTAPSSRRRSSPSGRTCRREASASSRGSFPWTRGATLSSSAGARAMPRREGPHLHGGPRRGSRLSPAPSSRARTT